MTNAHSTIKAATRNAFLDCLREKGNVTAAARLVGIDRVTAYRWRDADADFAQAWDDAIEEAADLIELEAHRRAVSGIDEPVIYQGDVTYLYERDEKGRVIHDTVQRKTIGLDGEPRIVTEQVPRLLLDAQGKPVTLAKRVYSDALMALLLKAHRPDKYRENSKIELNGSMSLSAMTEDEIRAELALLTATGITLPPDDGSDLV